LFDLLYISVIQIEQRLRQASAKVANRLIILQSSFALAATTGSEYILNVLEISKKYCIGFAPLSIRV